MKVLIAVYMDNERAGGSIRVAEVMARVLPEQGIDVNLAVAYGGGGRLSRLLGEKCHLIEASGPRDIVAWGRYRRLVNKISPDVVHYVDNVGWMIIAAACTSPRRVNYQHFRPDIGPNGRKRFLRIRCLQGTADKLIAISHGAARSLAQGYGVSPSKIAVVHNAVDASYLAHTKPAQSSERYILGMAVRIVEDKGLEDALNLLNLLPPNFMLAIAGDGPARHKFEMIAHEMGLSGRVIWKGSIDDVANFYAEIDLYLFMSWYEGFGLSVAEAMHCGIPVVGLLGDGEISETEYPLVTEENAVLVRRSNPKDFAIESDPRKLHCLAERIVTLVSDDSHRNDLVRTAQNWVKDRFSSQLFASKLARIYGELIPIAGKSDDN